MATSSKIAKMMSDHERYTTTFAEYSKRSKKYDVLRDWINSDFPEKIVKKVNFEGTEEFKMLGVGSGSGFVETCALKQLLTKWSKVEHTVVEPNSELINQFKDLAVKEKDNLPGVSFNWNQKTLEEFRQETSDHTTKYHLIMAIHMLYYVDNVEEVVKYLSNILADDGILVIMMISENSCFWRISEKFPQLQSESQHAIFSRHIEEILIANGNKFHTSQVDASIDSSGCFDKGSEEGELLIDFITQVSYLKKQVSESFYNEIVEFIKSDEVSLPKTEDGRTWLKCNYDATYITK